MIPFSPLKYPVLKLEFLSGKPVNLSIPCPNAIVNDVMTKRITSVKSFFIGNKFTNTCCPSQYLHN
jgi:hypothetical protein